MAHYPQQNQKGKTHGKLAFKGRWSDPKSGRQQGVSLVVNRGSQRSTGSSEENRGLGALAARSGLRALRASGVKEWEKGHEAVLSFKSFVKRIHSKGKKTTEEKDSYFRSDFILWVLSDEVFTGFLSIKRGGLALTRRQMDMKMPSFGVPFGGAFSALGGGLQGFEAPMSRAEAKKILNITSVAPNKEMVREAHRRPGFDGFRCWVCWVFWGCLSAFGMALGRVWALGWIGFSGGGCR